MRSRFAAAAGCCYYVPTPQPLPVQQPQQQQRRSHAANAHRDNEWGRTRRMTPPPLPSSTASSESDSIDAPPPRPPSTCRRSSGHRYVAKRFPARGPPRRAALLQRDCDDDACGETAVSHFEPRLISPTQPTSRPPSPSSAATATSSNVARRKYKSYEFFSSYSSAGPAVTAEEPSLSQSSPLRTREAAALTKPNETAFRPSQTTGMLATKKSGTKARTKTDNLLPLSPPDIAMAPAMGPTACSLPDTEPVSPAAQPGPSDCRDQFLLAASPLATPSPSGRPFAPALAADDLKKRPATMSLVAPASSTEWRKSFEFDKRTLREGSGWRRHPLRSPEGVHRSGSTRRPPLAVAAASAGGDRLSRVERATHHSNLGECARSLADTDAAPPPTGAAKSSPSVLSNTRSILKQAGSYEKTRPKVFIVRQNVAASLVPAAVCYRRHYLKIMFILLVVAPLCGLAASIAWAAVATHVTSGAVAGSGVDDALPSANDTDSSSDAHTTDSGGVG